MEFLSDRNNRVLSLLCKLQKKWGLYLGFSLPDLWNDGTAINLDELQKCVPYLNRDQITDLFIYGSAYLFCDSEEECYRYYNQTVGDDGPTKDNPYDGPVKVYALTCDPNGDLQAENT